MPAHVWDMLVTINLALKDMHSMVNDFHHITGGYRMYSLRWLCWELFPEHRTVAQFLFLLLDELELQWKERDDWQRFLSDAEVVQVEEWADAYLSPNPKPFPDAVLAKLWQRKYAREAAEQDEDNAVMIIE